MKNRSTKKSVPPEEGIFISNQDEIVTVHSEFIRDQMVKLNTDSKIELNITENEQYSNSTTLSISYIREKMILG